MEAPRFTADPGAIEGLPSQADSLSRLLDQVLGLIRRQFLLIISITVSAITVGIVYLMTTPPVFTAHARVLLDTSRSTPFQQQTGPVILFQTMDPGSVMTQVEILKSDGLAQRVVDNQHLAGDPSFTSGGATGLFQTLFGGLLRKAEKIEKAPDTRSQTDLNRTALSKILSSRTVTRVGETYVLDIGYSAQDAVLAAKMANAISDAYIDEQLDSKYQSTQRANVWLQDRIKELRAQAAAADRAVFDYKEKNKIVDVSGGGATSSSRLLDEDQVVQLNSQLISARGAAVEAKARLDRINEIMQQGVPDAGTADTLQSGIIGGLRTQYLDLDRRARIFSERYGATHLAVVNLRTQMAELRHSISEELNRIAQSHKSDYEIANARVQTIEKNLAVVIANAQLVNRDRLGLTDLETTAKIYRSLYDNFLNQYMQASQQQSFPSTQARVISLAQPGAQSAPNTHNVLASALFLGLMLGFGAGVLREAADRVFRTRNQVETTLRTNCLAVLPRLAAVPSTPGGAASNPLSTSERDSTSQRVLASDPNSMMAHVIDDPHSLFAEGLRSIKVAADITNAIKENKIIGVTSSVPKEGKSTISSNLAELAAHAGKRVILIDGDLRNLTLSRALARKAKCGLLEVLSGQTDLEKAVYVDPRTGLQFLPAQIDARFSHTDEILASKPFKALIESMRKNYDYIFVDLPPLAPVSDARATAGVIDSYIYVIEWGRTRINLVQNQLIAAPELYDRLLGVVLSKANLKILGRYEQYYGSDYYKYYNSRYRYGA